MTKFFCICVNMGAYHSTKNFEIFETRTNGAGIPHEVVPFTELNKFLIFYSALASSFGRDHSELDISCKDVAHSIKETL